MPKVKKFLKSKKFWIPFLNVAGMASLAFGLRGGQSERPSVPESPSKDSVPMITAPVQSVSFINDTIDFYATALLTYNNSRIVRFLVKNSHKHRMQIPYFVHEWRHHHNKKINYWQKIKYSPAQFIQLRMHEEISANVAAILAADLEYQLADDKNAVMNKYENTYMDFYFKAIKDGTIKPESTDTLERDKKFSLLVNGTIQMWEHKYRAHYTPSLMLMLKQYITNYGFQKPCDKNYRKILSHMYSFGDMDLSKYIKQDAVFPDYKIDILNELAKVPSLQGNGEFRENLFNAIYTHADQLQFFPVHQRKAVLQHIIISTKFKQNLKKLKQFALEPNQRAISSAYYQACYELAHDTNFQHFIDKCAYLDVTTVPFQDKKTCYDAFGMSSLLTESNRDFIAQLYSFRQRDLTKFIKNFDMNLLPANKENFLDFNKIYLADGPMEDLIVPMREKTYIPMEPKDSTDYDALISDATAPKNKPSKFGKHLSKNLFFLIPNFEEALLNPQALTPQVRQQLKQLFDDFNSIPTEFRECDVKSSQRYINQHGHPHYFENPKEPFKAQKRYYPKKNQKAPLVTLRNIKQRQQQKN